MYSLLLFLITPILGAFKNTVKYKNFNLPIFVRTPILCLFLYTLFYSFLDIDNKIIFLILILERWIMLVYKLLFAHINNNYIIKKEKYVKKYGFIYGHK